MAIVVETQDLKKTYMQGKVPVPALRGVDLRVEEGELVSIVGPSGSGKSTLLNMIGGLDLPTEGRVLIDGQDIQSMSKNQLTEHRRKVGFVFQSFNLISRLTALQNVELALTVQGIKGSQRRARAREILTMVGLKDRVDHKPTELSGGQQQRVAIARALARGDALKYLLMDEPTGNVDTKTRDVILDLVGDLNTRLGLTIILITHDEVVARTAKRTLYIVDGRVYASQAEFERLKTSPGATSESPSKSPTGGAPK